MRFFTAAFAAVAGLAAVVIAGENPIHMPDGKSPMVAGKPCTITWTASTKSTITLMLRQGPSNNLGTVDCIVANLTNSGTFTWTPPKTLPKAENYAIQIIDDESGSVNYTPLLVLDSPTSENHESKTNTATEATASATATATEATETASATKRPHYIPMAPHHGGNSTIQTVAKPHSNSTMTQKPKSSSGSDNSTSTGSPKATATPSEPSAPKDSTITGGAAHVASSPLALIACIVAGLIYFN